MFKAPHMNLSYLFLCGIIVIVLDMRVVYWMAYVVFVAHCIYFKNKIPGAN